MWIFNLHHSQISFLHTLLCTLNNGHPIMFHRKNVDHWMLSNYWPQLPNANQLNVNQLTCWRDKEKKAEFPFGNSRRQWEDPLLFPLPNPSFIFSCPRFTLFRFVGTGEVLSQMMPVYKGWVGPGGGGVQEDRLEGNICTTDWPSWWPKIHIKLYHLSLA